MLASLHPRMENQSAAPTKYCRKRPRGKYYPIKLACTYLAFRHGRVIEHGAAQTEEMSSTGVRLRSLDKIDMTATEIELSIAWPAKLPDGASLQFVVQGRPCWKGLKLAEVLIVKHEFRTAARDAHGLSNRVGYAARQAFRIPYGPVNGSYRPQVGVAALGA